MSDETYIPTTEEIREYVEVGGDPRPWLPPTPALDLARVEAFDRWLTEHDRQVAEQVIAWLDQDGTASKYTLNRAREHFLPDRTAAAGGTS